MKRFRLLRVRKSRLLLVALALVAFGLAVAANAFQHPATRRVPATAFSLQGMFTYNAATRRDPLVYPSGVATTGEELVLGDVRQLTLHFSATFASKLRQRLHGTVSIQEVFLGDSGWRNVYQIGEPTPFTGSLAGAAETLDVRRLQETLTRLQAGSATAARSYSLHLLAVVRYSGTVGPWHVKGSFSPALPFTIDAAVLAPQALGLPGEASQQALRKELHPTETVQLEHSIPNVIMFLAVRASAGEFRIAGCMVAICGIVLAFRSQRRRRKVVWSHERRIAHRAGRVLVNTVGLAESLPSSVRITVESFDDLVALAVAAHQPVLSDREAGIFAVDDAPRLYVYPNPAGSAVDHNTVDRTENRVDTPRQRRGKRDLPAQRKPA